MTFLEYLTSECFILAPRDLGDGRWAGVGQFLFTHAILTGRMGDPRNIMDRWCYSTRSAAEAALDAWDGAGEPVGWHRHPASGRRVARQIGETDGRGRCLKVGDRYIM